MAWALFGSQERGVLEMIEHSGSHRVTAIVGGALLDEALTRTVTERLRKHADIADKLFKVNGPLGNTVPKIDLLYMLYGIDDATRKGLYGIAEVRNFFAHNLDASFDSTKPKFVDGMSKLTMHEGRTKYPHHLKKGADSEHPIESIRNVRDRFVVNLKIGLIALMSDRVSHKTWSSEPG
ncbi:MAG TPA: hypothetical protein VFP60_06135 [Pseudolabrys sp.]|nr:hypothetical protein [Pseudolabrys sp.]